MIVLLSGTTGWRCLHLKDGLRNKPLGEARKFVATQFGALLLDLPFLVMLAVVYVTCYRIRSIHGHLSVWGPDKKQRIPWWSSCASPSARRYIILCEFGNIPLDVLFLVPLLVCLPNVPRFCVLCRDLYEALPHRRSVRVDKDDDAHEPADTRKDWSRRVLVLDHCLLALLDVPALLALVGVTLAGAFVFAVTWGRSCYRATSLWHVLTHKNTVGFYSRWPYYPEHRAAATWPYAVYETVEIVVDKRDHAAEMVRDHAAEMDGAAPCHHSGQRGVWSGWNSENCANSAHDPRQRTRALALRFSLGVPGGGWPHTTRPSVCGLRYPGHGHADSCCASCRSAIVPWRRRLGVACAWCNWLSYSWMSSRLPAA